MEILNLLFYRLHYLYKKEKDGALDSASNYLASIILVVLISVLGTIANLFYRPEAGWGMNTNRATLALFVVPIFVGLSYYIKRHYRKQDLAENEKKYGSNLKFNLFSLWLFMVLLIFLPAVLPKLLR